MLAAQAALDAALDAGTSAHEAIAGTAETHTLRFDPDALPRPRFLRAAAADGPLDPAALRQARLGATQAFAAGHITPAAWRTELARVRAHEGAAADERRGAGTPETADRGNAPAAAADAPSSAADPALAPLVTALALRATPPVTDDDDTAAIHVAAAEARTSQADAADAVAAVIDALPEETRDGLAAVITGANAAERISPDDTGEFQQAQLFVPRTVAPGAFPFGPQLYIPSERELAQMGEELRAFFEDLPPILAPRLGLLFGLGTILGTDKDDESDGDKNKDKGKGKDDDKNEDDGAAGAPRQLPAPTTPPPRGNPPKPPFIPPHLLSEDDDQPGPSPAPVVGSVAQQHDALVAQVWGDYRDVLTRFGIENEADLSVAIADVEKTPHVMRGLPDGRIVSGQFLDGRKGIVVIKDEQASIRALYSEDITDEEPKPAPVPNQPQDIADNDDDAGNVPSFDALNREEKVKRLVDGTWSFDQDAYQELGFFDRSSVQSLLEGTLDEPDVERALPGNRVARFRFLRGNEAIVVITDPSGALQEAGVFLGKDVPVDMAGLHERQADHAWTRHAAQFEKRGIPTRDHLRDKIATARENPLSLSFLKRGRTMFGVPLDDNGGLVIIDNPLTRDGGTAFFTPNLQKELERVRRKDLKNN